MAIPYNEQENDYLRRLQGQINVSDRQYTTDEAQAYQNYSPEAQKEIINTQQDYQMKSNEFGNAGEEPYGEYTGEYMGLQPVSQYEVPNANYEQGGGGGQNAGDSPAEGYEGDRTNAALDKALGYNQNYGWGDFKQEGLAAVTTGALMKQAGTTTARAIGGALTSGTLAGVMPFMLNQISMAAKRGMIRSDLESMAANFGLNKEQTQSAIQNATVSGKGFLDADESALNFALNEKKRKGFFSNIYGAMRGEDGMTGMMQSKDPDTGKITTTRDKPMPEDFNEYGLEDGYMRDDPNDPANMPDPSGGGTQGGFSMGNIDADLDAVDWGGWDEGSWGFGGSDSGTDSEGYGIG